MTAELPAASATISGEGGRVDPVWYRFFQGLRDLTSTALSTAQSAQDGSSGQAVTIGTLNDRVTALEGQTLNRGGLIEFPDDKAYVIWLDIPDAITVTRTICKTSTGTCTVTMSYGHTLSASTTEASATTEQSVAAGANITLTVSGSSSPEDLAFSIEYELTA